MHMYHIVLSNKIEIPIIYWNIYLALQSLPFKTLNPNLVTHHLTLPNWKFTSSIFGGKANSKYGSDQNILPWWG